MAFSHDLATVGGLFSPVKEEANNLVDYFEQDNVPEIYTQQLKTIRDQLDLSLREIMKQVYQELDEATIQALYQERLREWKQAFNELMSLVEHVIQTVPLEHSREVSKIFEDLKFFSDVKG